jgi:hypothetical protein
MPENEAREQAQALKDTAAETAQGVHDMADVEAQHVTDVAAQTAHAISDKATGKAQTLKDTADVTGHVLDDMAEAAAKGLVDKAEDIAKGLVDKAALIAQGLVDKANATSQSLLHTPIPGYTSVGDGNDSRLLKTPDRVTNLELWELVAQIREAGIGMRGEVLGLRNDVTGLRGEFVTLTKHVNDDVEALNKVINGKLDDGQLLTSLGFALMNNRYARWALGVVFFAVIGSTLYQHRAWTLLEWLQSFVSK